jgi:hypothetical protein
LNHFFVMNFFKMMESLTNYLLEAGFEL